MFSGNSWGISFCCSDWQGHKQIMPNVPIKALELWRSCHHLPPLMFSHSLPLPVWSKWAGHRAQHWECCWRPLWDWGLRLPAHGQGEAEPILPLLNSSGSSGSSGLCSSCTPEVNLLGAKPVQVIKLPINLAAHLLVSGCVCMCCFLFI